MKWLLFCFVFAWSIVIFGATVAIVGLILFNKFLLILGTFFILFSYVLFVLGVDYLDDF